MCELAETALPLFDFHRLNHPFRFSFSTQWSYYLLSAILSQDFANFKYLQDFAFVNNCFMESPNKIRRNDCSFWDSLLGNQSLSYTEPSLKERCCPRDALRDFNVEIAPIFQKTITTEGLSAFVLQLVDQVYELDGIGTGKMIVEFLSQDLPKQRQRIAERLSLLKYVVQSLNYKPFGEVEAYILKEWKKNVLFFSISTVWTANMTAHKFTSLREFTQEYKKQVALIANLTHFYFKDALALLDGSNVATFCHFQEETAHKVINSSRDWKELYQQKLIPLLRKQYASRNCWMDMHYDPKALLINEQYLDFQSGKDHLTETVQKIKELAAQTAVHRKIELLKEMRSTFIGQIEESRKLISKHRRSQKYSALQKDDIIGCMIYCILSGQITDIQSSLQSISELLGPNNELFSRKGVDSYRADLQSAVEYLCQQRQLSGLQNGKLLEEEEVKVQFTNRSTHLELSSLK